MTWSLNLTADKPIEPGHVARALTELPTEHRPYPYSVPRYDWGWGATIVDIYNPVKNKIHLTGKDNYDNQAKAFVKSFNQALSAQGYRLEISDLVS